MGFIGFFLHKSYQEEKEALTKEAGYLFISAIRDIEEDLLNRFVMDKKRNLKFKTRTREHLPHADEDTVQVFTYVSEQNFGFFEQEDSFKIEIREFQEDNDLSNMSGSISMIIELASDSADSSKAHGVVVNKDKFLPHLIMSFAQSADAAQLPIDYEIFKTGADSTRNTNYLIAGSYTDISNNEKYQLGITDYQRFLLMRIWPEILIGLALFLCVGFAFFVVLRSLQKQHRLTELKNDFVQNISHELKTPIATVSVALEAMSGFEAMKDPTQMREYLEISRLELKRLSLLTDKVLSISKNGDKQLVLDLQPLDLNRITQEVIAALRLHAEKLGTRFELITQPGDYGLTGDSLHLSGVIYNLVDNALKYGSENQTIELELENDEKQLTLSVKDQGQGIPEPYQNKVFDRFFRVPDPEGHRTKGHGLGLSYASRIIERHGGKIGFFNRKEGGACFYIILPKETHG